MTKAKQFEEYVQDMNNGTYDFTKNGKCTGCGACCSNLLPMTDDEIRTIRKHIKSHGIKEFKHLLPLANPSVDMTCPFMDDSKKCDKCMIYEVRPKICRDFICDPKQRPMDMDLRYMLSAKIVNVREEFFRKRG